MGMNAKTKAASDGSALFAPGARPRVAALGADDLGRLARYHAGTRAGLYAERAAAALRFRAAGRVVAALAAERDCAALAPYVADVLSL